MIKKWPYWILGILLVLFSALVSYRIYAFRIGFFLSLVSLIILIYASLIDLRDQEIDWRILVVGLVSAVAFYIFTFGFNIAGIALSAFGCALIPLILVIASRERWMGWGDVLIALWVGLLASFPRSLLAIFLAFFVGSVSGIITLKTGSQRKTLAFGPYLLVGCLLALAFGDKIIVWYLGVF